MGKQVSRSFKRAATNQLRILRDRSTRTRAPSDLTHRQSPLGCLRNPGELLIGHGFEGKLHGNAPHASRRLIPKV